MGFKAVLPGDYLLLQLALCSEMVICYSAESFQKLSEIVIMFFIVEIRKPKLGEFEEIVQS